MKLYTPNPVNDFVLHSYEEEIPLAFNVIYYVEAPNNEPLNAAMRQLADKAEPLFEDTEIQPHPFRLQYIAQSELNEEALLAKLSDTFGKTKATKAVRIFRRCLLDGRGGTLSARCLPDFSNNDVFEDDHAVHTYVNFLLSSAQEAADNARWFASETAKLNFYRLAGVSYEEYLKAKRPPKKRTRSNSAGKSRTKDFCIRHCQSATTSSDRKPKPYEELGFIVREKTQQEITATQRKHAEELTQLLGKYTSDDQEITTILEIALKLQKEKGKLTDIRILKIEDDKLYLYLSEHQKQEVRFGRGDIAKMLYIFFLIQKKRSEKDHQQPKYLTQADLETHKEDLLYIYTIIGRYWDADINSIKSVWDKDYNDFANALSSIRRCFKQFFDTKTAYRYSIEIQSKHPEFGSMYGIDLDGKDFDLGSFKRMV